FFFSSRRRHTRFSRDWSSDVCSSDLKSEKVALPIHFFCPFSTQPSAVRLHVVVSPPAVPDPTNGSVNPKAPIFSKRCIAGSHSSFCASDPHIYIEPIAKPL